MTALTYAAFGDIMVTVLEAKGNGYIAVTNGVMMEIQYKTMRDPEHACLTAKNCYKRVMANAKYEGHKVISPIICGSGWAQYRAKGRSLKIKLNWKKAVVAA